MWWRALFIGIYGVIQTDGGDIVLMLPQAVYYDAEYETEKLPYITIDASRDGDAITRSFNLSNVTEKLEMGRKYVYELALYYTGDPLPKILPKDPSEITGDYWRAEKPDTAPLHRLLEAIG